MNVSATGNMQQSPADLAMDMSNQASGSVSSSVNASITSSLESSSFDGMDMMMAGMDSSTDSEQMMRMAIALIILQMINGGGAGATGGESGTDLLGMLAADALLQSAGQGSSQTTSQSTEASVSIEQSASFNYTQNAYASSSLDSQDPNQQLSNVDVMI